MAKKEQKQQILETAATEMFADSYLLITFTFEKLKSFINKLSPLLSAQEFQLLHSFLQQIPEKQDISLPLKQLIQPFCYIQDLTEMLIRKHGLPDQFRTEAVQTMLTASLPATSRQAWRPSRACS